MRHTLATRSSKKAAGFTIVELLLAIILSGVIITIFVSTLMSMMRTATIQKTQLELSQKNQIALDTIERDIRVALAFDTSPAFAAFTDSYGPNNIDNTWSGTWSYKGSDANHRVLILRQSATTTNPLARSRSPVYVQGSLVNPYAEQNASLNCTAYNSSTAPTGTLSYNPPLPYYIIYFVRDNKLYRRILTDAQTTLCASSVQYQKQSCPKADTTPHANCRAYDELIAENVASFSVAYNTITYNSAGQATVVDSGAYAVSDPDALAETSNVLVTLKLQKIVSGADTNTTLSVRVSRAN